jgi:hypothetical protein
MAFVLKHAIDLAFSEFEIHPILADLGARDHSPTIWRAIAPHSIYVGVGPEAQSLLAASEKTFWRAHLVDSAITELEGQNARIANTCANPVFSSFLTPNPSNSSQYLDLDRGVVSRSEWRTSSVNTVVQRLDIERLDWIHLNVNGVEARIYNGIGTDLRKNILALDTSLDFIDIYRDQDKTLEAYRDYVRDGLWLSTIHHFGPVRITLPSRAALLEQDPAISELYFEQYHRRIPGWLFGRFFRTIESLREGAFSRREYIVLWSFACSDGQFGYAADVAFEYKRLFGSDQSFKAMLEETIRGIKSLQPRWSVSTLVRNVVPPAMQHRLRRMLLGR